MRLRIRKLSLCGHCGFRLVSRGPLRADKVIVLLGAGASREAGFPLTAEVTPRLLSHFRAEARANHAQSSRPWKVRAIHLRLLEELAKSCAKTKENTQAEEVPFEVILTLLRMLSGVDLPELEPWWRGLLNARYANLLHTHNNFLLVGQLESAVRRFVSELFAAKPHRTAYLRHLVELSPPGQALPVFTLNYDRSLELAFQRSGVRFTNGFANGQWRPSLLNPNTGRFHVLVHQLHGAVSWNDWQSALRPVHRYLFLGGTARKLVPTEEYHWLFDAFVRELEKATVLVVIGYSWQDLHINLPVLRRAEAADKCDFRIINISPETPRIFELHHKRKVEEKFQCLYMRAAYALSRAHVLHVLNSPELRGMPLITPEKSSELGTIYEPMSGNTDLRIPRRGKLCQAWP